MNKDILKLADELAACLSTMRYEIENSGNDYILGACFEESERLLSLWWKSSKEVENANTN